MLIGSGLITVEELAAGEAHGTRPEGLPEPMDAAAVNAAKLAGARFDRPYDGEPRFSVGDAVRARLISPTGHCRLPAYVRGHAGEVTACHGAHVLADAAAHNRTVIEPLYTVRFLIADLFDERAGSPDTVHLDLWESHLDTV